MKDFLKNVNVHYVTPDQQKQHWATLTLATASLEGMLRYLGVQDVMENHGSTSTEATGNQTTTTDTTA